MDNFKPWPDPLPFIETVDGKLEINSHTAGLLRKICDSVVVVAISGSYRTGKSYLMNRLAGKQGFELGSELRSKTKGIWIWCREHPSQPDKILVLIDTEGLDDPDKLDGENHDIKIFSLAVLLSSTFIFNAVGKIDQDMINKLHFVTEVIERIRVCSQSPKDEDYEEYSRYFPLFVLVVRDFTLQLKLDGDDVTPDDYFNYVLKLKEGTRRQIVRYNMPREAIRGAFRHHRCFVFSRPVEDEALFPALGSLTEDKLTPRFVQQSKEFCAFILKNSRVKNVKQEQNATGCFLLAMAEAYVDAINEGSIPCIESTVEYVIQNENERVLRESLTLYEETMSELTSSISNEEFDDVHSEANRKAMDHFYTYVTFDNEKNYFNVLCGNLLRSCASYRDRNERFSKEQCEHVLEKLSNEGLKKNIENNKFIVPGGYEDYESCVNVLLQQYDTNTNQEIKRDEVKQNFLKQQEQTRSLIIATDTTLSKQEKDIENIRKQLEATEQERKVVKDVASGKEEWLEKLQKEHDRQIIRMQEQFSRQVDARVMRAEEMSRTLIEDKLKMMELGYESKIGILEDEINRLKEGNNAGGNRLTKFLESCEKVSELLAVGVGLVGTMRSATAVTEAATSGVKKSFKDFKGCPFSRRKAAKALAEAAEALPKPE